MYSALSMKKLNECHQDLQRLFYHVEKRCECTIVCGPRTKDAQNELFAKGYSQKKWPYSKHNITDDRKLSEALDAAPCPIDWLDIPRFEEFGKLVKSMAATMNIKIVWGGDWPNLKDYSHFELA